MFIPLSLRRLPGIGGRSLHFSFNFKALVNSLRVLARRTREILKALLLSTDLPLRAILATPLDDDLRVLAELLLALYNFDTLLLFRRAQGTSF